MSTTLARQMNTYCDTQLYIHCQNYVRCQLKLCRVMHLFTELTASKLKTLKQIFHFRHVKKIEKRGDYLRLVCRSVSLSVRIELFG